MFIPAFLILLTIFHGTQGDCPRIVTRKEWFAKPARKVEKLIISPAKYVVVHQTEDHQCDTLQKCKNRMYSTQDYALKIGRVDTPYNFMIGGDGNVYEGRGYGVYGDHSPAYDDRSIGIGIIGNFTEIEPNDDLVDTLQRFVTCAKDQGYLTSTFKLIGHSQSEYVKCPGKLQKKIEKLPQWSPWAD